MPEEKYHSLIIKCENCSGTGVYKHPLVDKPELGVVCEECDGEGSKTLNYTLFTERKQRDDVQVVQRSTIFGYPQGEKVTYEEFLAGKKPARLPTGGGGGTG